MNDHEYNSLFAALNEAADILHRHRSPDPAYIAAYDTLKQARAMIGQAIQPPAAVLSPLSVQLAA